MAIIGRIPAAQLGTVYTHYGWFCGLVPIYVGDVSSEAPRVAVRNWIPDWTLDVADAVFGVFAASYTWMTGIDEVPWPILLAGKIR